MIIKKSNQASSSIFSQHQKQPQADLSIVYKDINEIGRRIRIMEERYNNLQNKSQITEQNVISKNKQLSNEIKTTNLEVHEIKKEIQELKDQIIIIIKELQNSAKKDDIRIIEKYVNYWQPMNFVTRNEVEDIITRKLNTSLVQNKK